MNIFRGDFGYAVEFTLQEADGDAYDLTGKTATWLVWREGLQGRTVSATCTYSTGTSGVCTYTLQAADFPDVGPFVGAIEVTQGTTLKRTFGDPDNANEGFAVNILERP